MCYLLRPITHSFLNLYNFFRSYSATFNNIVISICGGWIGQWMDGFWKHFCLLFGFLQLQRTGPGFWTLRVIKIFLPRFRIQGEIFLVDLVNNSCQIGSFAYPYSPTLLYVQLLFGFQLQVLQITITIILIEICHGQTNHTKSIIRNQLSEESMDNVDFQLYMT